MKYLASNRCLAKGVRGVRVRKAPPPCPTQISSFWSQQKACLFWFYALNCRILRFVLYLCRKRGPHHNFWFHKMAHLVALSVSNHFVATFQMTLKHLIMPRRLTWFDLTLSWVWILPVTLPNGFPHRIQAHSLLHKKPSLQSQTCNKPVCHQKAIKFT